MMTVLKIHKGEKCRIFPPDAGCCISQTLLQSVGKLYIDGPSEVRAKGSGTNTVSAASEGWALGSVLLWL